MGAVVVRLMGPTSWVINKRRPSFHPLVGASVRVTLGIEAEVPAGAPGHVVRVVTENSRTLKFTSQGFESELVGPTNW